MAPSPRHRAGAGAADKPDQYELLYNSAVQAFVRRDHAKTQASLEKLLALTRELPRDPVPWYDLSSAGSDEWVTKTLKLAISANASLYSDPPKVFHNPQMAHLLPPAPPSAMLEYIKEQCVSTYGAALLPPQLVSTFLLAALKLRPSESALGFAHALAEDWLTTLPDSFVHAIAQPATPASASSAERKRTEAAREGYIKVVELFVGEVLGREGEWEMARGLLEGEMVMGSKKKEALYRHLRQLESQRTPAASPSSSGLLPSPDSSGILPATPTRGSRSRSNATSSTSSSEATARPAGDKATGLTSRAVKGKQPARDESEGDSTIQPATSETTEVPSKIYVHHGSGNGNSGSARPVPERRVGGFLYTTLALLPAPLAARIEALSRSGWLLPALLPFPIVLALVIVGLLRRRRRPGQVLSVRERLRQARVHGFGGWLAVVFRWWVEKLAGVWKLGTTITYV